MTITTDRPCASLSLSSPPRPLPTLSTLSSAVDDDTRGPAVAFSTAPLHHDASSCLEAQKGQHTALYAKADALHRGASVAEDARPVLSGAEALALMRSERWGMAWHGALGGLVRLTQAESGLIVDFCAVLTWCTSVCLVRVLREFFSIFESDRVLEKYVFEQKPPSRASVRST